MLSIRNLSHHYAKKGKIISQIISNLNLEIKKGEIVSILGKSGCGKTTLANIICGYIKPTEGNIYIDGIMSTLPSKNKIMVNQENDLFDWMTVEENMKIATERITIIDKYLKLVKLENTKLDYPSKLSGGMKKRLSLARALAANPDLLILDEPFSYLDQVTKMEILDELLKIVKSTKTTTILITHNIDEAVYLSDRIVILSGNPSHLVKDIKIDNHTVTKQLIEKIKKFY